MRKISDIDKTIKSYEAGYKVGFSDAKRIILENLITEVGNYELRELKAYRKAKKKIIENMKAWEKIYNEPLEWNVEDINSIKLAFYQNGKADAYTDCIGICEIAFEEVAADDSSRTIE